MLRKFRLERRDKKRNNMEKQAETLYHVIAINPEQQSALKFCLFHLTSLKTMFCINTLLKDPTPDRAEQSADSIIKTFSDYDMITSEWPLIGDAKPKGKFKLYHFDKFNFNWIRQSIERFDPDAARLMIGEDKSTAVVKQIPSLKKLFAESSKYEYTHAEIRTEWGKK